LDTIEFFSKFVEGRLGRKRQLGAYHVAEGEHCFLLIKSEGAMKHPLFLKFKDSDLTIAGIDARANFRYNIRKWVDNDSGITCTTLNIRDNPAVLESGVIACEGNNYLIEIGNTPYLLEPFFATGVSPISRYLERGAIVAPSVKSDVTSKIPIRVSTIRDARKELIPKDNENMYLVSNLTLKDMGPDFNPPTPVDAKDTVLKHKNPLQYGVPLRAITFDSLREMGVTTNKVSPALTIDEADCVESWRHAHQRYVDAKAALSQHLDTSHINFNSFFNPEISFTTDGISYVRGRLTPSGHRFRSNFKNDSFTTLENYHQVMGVLGGMT